MGLYGTLTSIISGPKLILPVESLKLLGIKRLKFNSIEQGQQIVRILKKISNDIISNLISKKYSPFSLIDVSSSWKTTFLEAKVWANGYIKGVETWGVDFDTIFYSDEHYVLKNAILPIASVIISDNNFYKNCSDEEFLKFRKESIEVLPYAAIMAYDFWSPSRKQINQLLTSIWEDIVKYYGCPCGSGKKYEKCCLH